MYKIDTNRLQNVIVGLKKVKASSFIKKEGLFNIQDVIEICRITDTIMLPLYYIWEYYCHRQLNELCFEEHLRKPYQRFLKNPIAYTWEMFILISLCIPFNDYLWKESVYSEIIDIYKDFLEYYKYHKCN